MIYKIDRETVKRIVDLHQVQGLSIPILSERFGISTARINDIFRRHRKKPQAASCNSDEPTHRINKTNWYLKFKKGKPAFFIKAENVFKEMPIKCFIATAGAKSHELEMVGWQKQVEQYFNQPIEEINKHKA